MAGASPLILAVQSIEPLSSNRMLREKKTQSRRAIMARGRNMQSRELTLREWDSSTEKRRMKAESGN